MSTFISSLPHDVKKWFAEAVAGMILADGQVSEAELDHFKNTIRFLGSIEEVNEVVHLIKQRTPPNLKILKTDRKVASHVYMQLALLAITDDHLSKKEVKYFYLIGTKLGFDEGFSDKIMKWAVEMLKVNRQKAELIKEAQRTDPAYKSYTKV